ncbi:PREDICTED: uncharacterized protein LOC104807409 [Tarenaya hassleriana]|uniref:uncharacterized protein LOC104807409 n=1 Tax=Tarenaya hassleriana TaxID=28532 RepID=UPI00053C0D1F|nr:PREDICTED: uncharacterized protein LOC104807409 [Tarenaya hassleriana]
MSSVMETLQIRRFASLPVSQPSSADAGDQPGLLRRRLSSLSLNLSQPVADRFPRSKSVSAMGEQAGSSIREWWGWGWAWILSRKPIFVRDLEMDKDEAKVLGSHNRGSLMHVFFKLRSEIRRLLRSSDGGDALPLSCKHGARR